MTTLALADFLKDFGSRPQQAASVIPAHVPAAPPPPTMEETVGAAVLKAEKILQERLALEHAAEIETLRQEHAAEMDAALRQVGENAGQTIAQRLAEMEERVSREASLTAARILGAFLSDELQKRSVESLAGSIREAIADRESFRAEVRGPQSLCQALLDAIGERAVEFSFVEAPGFDLFVTVDGTLFETRLSEWAQTLAGILE